MHQRHCSLFGAVYKPTKASRDPRLCCRPTAMFLLCERFCNQDGSTIAATAAGIRCMKIMDRRVTCVNERHYWFHAGRRILETTQRQLMNLINSSQSTPCLKKLCKIVFAITLSNFHQLR